MIGDTNYKQEQETKEIEAAIEEAAKLKREAKDPDCGMNAEQVFAILEKKWGVKMIS